MREEKTRSAAQGSQHGGFGCPVVCFTEPDEDREPRPAAPEGAFPAPERHNQDRGLGRVRKLSRDCWGKIGGLAAGDTGATEHRLSWMLGGRTGARACSGCGCRRTRSSGWRTCTAWRPSVSCGCRRTASPPSRCVGSRTFACVVLAVALSSPLLGCSQKSKLTTGGPCRAGPGLAGASGDPRAGWQPHHGVQGAAVTPPHCFTASTHADSGAVSLTRPSAPRVGPVQEVQRLTVLPSLAK